jgi:hypothetical protein
LFLSWDISDVYLSALRDCSRVRELEDGDVLTIQSACDRHWVFLTEYDIQLCRCGLRDEVFGRRFEQLLSVIALVSLKCLFTITMCQWYLSTIKLFSSNYVWCFQSRFSISILPPKKALPGVPCYLNGTCRLLISCPPLGKYTPDSGAFIWLHVGDDQARGTMLFAHAQDMRRQRCRDV